ncbi:MAG TPA: hypothetical protein VKG67_01385 [Gallionellaceae bacterium]|nr:hypothetical protein [Gallionellaceae bacterium]
MTDGGNAAVVIQNRMLNRIAFLTQEHFAYWASYQAVEKRRVQ